MNLETLLEAAKYVEYSSKAKARGEEPHDYNTFGRLYSCDEPLVTRSHHKPVSSKQDRETFTNHPDTSKERRRLSSGIISKEPPILNDEAQGGGGTREVHNKLEKNRRAHLKECFETLKRQLPNMEDRKTSNLSILRGALRYIQSLKRKEREYEHEMERLAREKIAAQQKLAALRKELSSQSDHIDVNTLLPDDDNETTTTASECGGMQLSDVDYDDDAQIEISSTSRHHNSSSSDVTSPASSIVSNTATSDSMTGRTTVTSVAADESVVASKPISTSLIPEVLTAASPSMITTTSISSALSLSTVSTTDSMSMSQNLPKIQACMTTSSLASANSLLHTSSGNPSSSHVSLSSQVSTACSFQVGTVLANPHTNTIQVITQPGGVKVIATPNPLGNSSSVGHSTNTPTVQNGPLHILTSTASLMAIGAQNATGTSSIVTSSPKTTGTQSLVRVAPIPGVNSAKQLMPPLTLVASQAVMGVTQVTTATKSIIINQVAGLTPSSTVSTEGSNTGIVKSSAITSSSTITTTTTLAAKGSNQANNVLTTVTATVASQSNVITALQTTKPLSHIVQSNMGGRSIATPQILPTAVPASQINSVGRHIVAASLKSVSPAARSISQLSGVAHVTHVMPQTPVAASVSHIVSAGTPLVTPMSMVSHSATVHHPQVYSAQPQLGKVITSPVLKSVGQIPIIPQQFLQPAVGSVTAQPVVVVSMAAASNGPPTSVVTSSANKQPGAISVPVTQ